MIITMMIMMIAMFDCDDGERALDSDDDERDNVDGDYQLRQHATINYISKHY